jgi:hypothetical protein
LEKQLAKIRKDTTVQKKIKQQSAKLQELERTVNSLRKELGTASSPKEPVLRKKRNVVFKEIDALEEKKIAIINRIKKRSRNARQHIIKGMTNDEVISLLGEPDGRSPGGSYWKYGNVEITFEYGVVTYINK